MPQSVSNRGFTCRSISSWQTVFVGILFLYIFCIFYIKPSFADDESPNLSENQKTAINDQKNEKSPGDVNIEVDDLNLGISMDLIQKMKENDYVHGFVASISVIIVSELGDKTFFIAAIMSMKHDRLTVLTAALGALAVMTVIASIVGHMITVIPRTVTYYISSLLFLVFGLKMLKEASSMTPDEGQHEFEEVQAELKKKEEARTTCIDPESGVTLAAPPSVLRAIFSSVFLEAFTLTFLAEWGDRSQIATVVLAARENALAVTIGGILGHAICTGLAVLGGRMVAQKISVRNVTFIGAFIFILFGLSALVLPP